GRATVVTPAVGFTVHPAWTSAFPTTTIAAAPPRRAIPNARPRAAGPRDTDWRRCRADVAAGATVVGVPVQVRTRAIATHGPLDAGVHAPAGNARGLLVGTGLTDVPAGPSVAHVVGEVVADDAGAAGPAEAAGGAGARTARREAGVLLPLVGTPADG